MKREILARMTGEELLLLRILGGDSAAAAISAELDRRAAPGRRGPRRSEPYWAGRNFAMRKSARLAA